MTALNEQVGGDHYKSMAIQPIEFCHKNGLGCCESLAIKYICRHGKKNGRQDIEKAIHCLNLLLDMEYGVEPPKEKLYRTLSQEEIDSWKRWFHDKAKTSPLAKELEKSAVRDWTEGN